MSKGKKRSGARPGRPQPLRGTKGKRKGARLWYVGVNNFNCRGFGPLLEDKLCLIFKLAPSVCRMTFPILASLLVRLVVLLPFQLLRLSLATPSRWTPLALKIKFMKDGVNATPLPTVNTTGYIDHAAFLGTINPDTNKIPKHLFQGYLNIYNNYFKAPWMPDRTEANP